MSAAVLGLVMLAGIIATVATMWRAGNAAIPQRERKALETIRKHGRCTTVKRPAR